jgi:hypothetical protein
MWKTPAESLRPRSVSERDKAPQNELNALQSRLESQARNLLKVGKREDVQHAVSRLDSERCAALGADDGCTFELAVLVFVRCSLGAIDVVEAGERRRSDRDPETRQGADGVDAVVGGVGRLLIERELQVLRVSDELVAALVKDKGSEDVASAVVVNGREAFADEPRPANISELEDAAQTGRRRDDEARRAVVVCRESQLSCRGNRSE